MAHESDQFRKVLLFGGVYNNYLALERLLEEAARLGVDALFCLGDVGGFGPFPDRSFPLLRSGAIRTLAGNYDISVAQEREDCGCGYTDPRDNHFARISYRYTLTHTAKENRAWLAHLPTSIRFQLGPLKVLLCHGSPRRTNEFLWESTSPDHLLEKFLREEDVDLVCCTHTGIKWQRRLPSGGYFLNTGVIGRPENDGQTHVWFTLLEHEGRDLQCDFLPLEYDHQRLAQEMRSEGLPDEFVETILSGWWTTCLEILPAKERLRGRF